MPDESAVRLSNPMRYLVPIGTAILALVMFIPPIVFTGVSGWRVVAGVAILAASLLWLVRSAWIAPFELTIAKAGLDVRRWSGARRYESGRVRKWWFAIPDGAPTQVAPSTNGVLYVVFDDRTRFRGEVTSDEARKIAQTLDQVR